MSVVIRVEMRRIYECGLRPKHWRVQCGAHTTHDSRVRVSPDRSPLAVRPLLRLRIASFAGSGDQVIIGSSRDGNELF
jgi:hypothetical protein